MSLLLEIPLVIIACIQILQVLVEQKINGVIIHFLITRKEMDLDPTLSLNQKIVMLILVIKLKKVLKLAEKSPI